MQDYQDHKAIFILKYNAEEVRNLKAYGELLDHVNINDAEGFGMDTDDNITFDDFGKDDDDIDEIERPLGFLQDSTFPYSITNPS